MHGSAREGAGTADEQRVGGSQPQREAVLVRDAKQDDDEDDDDERREQPSVARDAGGTREWSPQRDSDVPVGDALTDAVASAAGTTEPRSVDAIGIVTPT